MGLLAVIALTVIAAWRNSASKVSCRDNLAALAQSTIDYENIHQRLPSGLWYQEIMAYRDSPLYNEVIAAGDSPDGQLPILTCPSDRGTYYLDAGGYTNYLANHGVWSLLPEQIGPIQIRSDQSQPPITWQDVTDGRQSTALFSEVLRGGPERLRMIWSLPDGPFAADELEVFVDIAKNLPKNPLTEKMVGHKSSKGRIIGRSLAPGAPIVYSQAIGRSLYNHAALPQTPSCHNGGKPHEAIVPPSSGHDVVHVAFCDGRVEPVTPQIDLSIWRSYGSMKGAD